jgi:hypothetical protein
MKSRVSSTRTMKLQVLVLIALNAASIAAPPVKLTDFQLTDQDSKTRTYRFPKTKITVMTVADHKGSEQLAPWIQRIRDRYESRIDIDGVADMSSVPTFLRDTIRKAFRKELTYSVMLDWDGDVVKLFDYKKSVANIYLIDHAGRIVKQMSGPHTDSATAELFEHIDRVMRSAPQP